MNALSTRLASFAAAFALASSFALAQETEAPKQGSVPVRIGTKNGPEKPVETEAKKESPKFNPLEDVAVQDDAQAKMIELFGKVERRLNQIDRLLTDASAGDTSKLKDVDESGIDKLLDLSRREGQQAVQDIDEILLLAEQMNQQCNSPGQSGSCDKPGSTGEGGKPSPIDQAGQQSTQRESTPEAPQPKTAQNNEDQNGQKPQPKPSDGGQPNSPLDSQDDDPTNAPGQNPPGSDVEVAGQISDLDRWGDLPVHARDVFRSEGGGGMPARYRDWIDSYYRRLNERR